MISINISKTLNLLNNNFETTLNNILQDIISQNIDNINEFNSILEDKLIEYFKSNKFSQTFLYNTLNNNISIINLIYSNLYSNNNNKYFYSYIYNKNIPISNNLSLSSISLNFTFSKERPPFFNINKNIFDINTNTNYENILYNIYINNYKINDIISKKINITKSISSNTNSLPIIIDYSNAITTTSIKIPITIFITLDILINIKYIKSELEYTTNIEIKYLPLHQQTPLYDSPLLLLNIILTTQPQKLSQYINTNKLPIFYNKLKSQNLTSIPLLRTNPKLASNIKIIINENHNLFLSTISSNESLSSSMFQNIPINTNTSHENNMKKIFSIINKNSIFALPTTNNQTHIENQYDFTYFIKSSYTYSPYHKEKFSIFAPIYLKNNIPEHFVIFKSNPLNKNKFSQIRNASIVKTFNLSNNNISNYLKNIYINSKPILINISNPQNSFIYGLDTNSATSTAKNINISNIINNDVPITLFDKFITNLFENNNTILNNIVNLEFLFNDKKSNSWELNNYYGLYCDKIKLLKVMHINLDSLYINSLENSYNKSLNFLNQQQINSNKFVVIPRGLEASPVLAPGGRCIFSPKFVNYDEKYAWFNFIDIYNSIEKIYLKNTTNLIEREKYGCKISKELIDDKDIFVCLVGKSGEMYRIKEYKKHTENIENKSINQKKGKVIGEILSNNKNNNREIISIAINKEDIKGVDLEKEFFGVDEEKSYDVEGIVGDDIDIMNFGMEKSILFGGQYIISDDIIYKKIKNRKNIIIDIFNGNRGERGIYRVVIGDFYGGDKEYVERVDEEKNIYVCVVDVSDLMGVNEKKVIIVGEIIKRIERVFERCYNGIIIEYDEENEEIIFINRDTGKSYISIRSDNINDVIRLKHYGRELFDNIKNIEIYYKIRSEDGYDVYFGDVYKYMGRVSDKVREYRGGVFVKNSKEIYVEDLTDVYRNIIINNIYKLYVSNDSDNILSDYYDYIDNKYREDLDKNFRVYYLVSRDEYKLLYGDGGVVDRFMVENRYLLVDRRYDGIINYINSNYGSNININDIDDVGRIFVRFSFLGSGSNKRVVIDIDMDDVEIESVVMDKYKRVYISSGGDYSIRYKYGGNGGVDMKIFLKREIMGGLYNNIDVWGNGIDVGKKNIILSYDIDVGGVCEVYGDYFLSCCRFYCSDDERVRRYGEYVVRSENFNDEYSVSRIIDDVDNDVRMYFDEGIVYLNGCGVCGYGVGVENIQLFNGDGCGCCNRFIYMMHNNVCCFVGGVDDYGRSLVVDRKYVENINIDDGDILFMDSRNRYVGLEEYYVGMFRVRKYSLPYFGGLFMYRGKKVGENVVEWGLYGVERDLDKVIMDKFNYKEKSYIVLGMDGGEINLWGKKNNDRYVGGNLMGGGVRFGGVDNKKNVFVGKRLFYPDIVLLSFYGLKDINTYFNGDSRCENVNYLNSELRYLRDIEINKSEEKIKDVIERLYIDINKKISFVNVKDLEVCGGSIIEYEDGDIMYVNDDDIKLEDDIILESKNVEYNNRYSFEGVNSFKDFWDIGDDDRIKRINSEIEMIKEDINRLIENKKLAVSNEEKFNILMEIENKRKELSNKIYEKYVYNSLDTEYLKYRELFLRELRNESKVIPYIVKWGLEGSKDTCNNIYRLTNNNVFGVNNFSPDYYINFVNSNFLTNEYFYIDEGIINEKEKRLYSNNYLFNKISDEVENNLRSGDVDYFSKYFIVGKGNMIMYNENNEEININEYKNIDVDEKYVYLKYNREMNVSECVFKGIKINIKGNYNNYRFNIIFSLNNKINRDIDISGIINNKFKFITIIIKMNINDYRILRNKMLYSNFYLIRNILEMYEISFVNNEIRMNDDFKIGVDEWEKMWNINGDSSNINKIFIKKYGNIFTDFYIKNNYIWGDVYKVRYENINENVISDYFNRLRLKYIEYNKRINGIFNYYNVSKNFYDGGSNDIKICDENIIGCFYEGNYIGNHLMSLFNDGDVEENLKNMYSILVNNGYNISDKIFNKLTFNSFRNYIEGKNISWDIISDSGVVRGVRDIDISFIKYEEIEKDNMLMIGVNRDIKVEKMNVVGRDGVGGNSDRILSELDEIEFELISNNNRVKINRYSGYYEPLFENILYFYAGINYDKYGLNGMKYDYILQNIKFDVDNENFGVLRELYRYKIYRDKNILDSNNIFYDRFNVFKSYIEDGFYRVYVDREKYKLLDGYMVETDNQGGLGCVLLNYEDKIVINSFSDGEIKLINNNNEIVIEIDMEEKIYNYIREKLEGSGVKKYFSEKYIKMLIKKVYIINKINIYNISLLSKYKKDSEYINILRDNFKINKKLDEVKVINEIMVDQKIVENLDKNKYIIKKDLIKNIKIEKKSDLSYMIYLKKSSIISNNKILIEFLIFRN